jgi:YegS/Rv2252/BmrU family lipid kinase
VALICSLIINPVSGGYSKTKLEKAIAALQEGGCIVELLMTKCADDATLFARRVCRERGNPFLIAGGGDGTVNGVINGLVPEKATLAVLPLGTANVLSKELGIQSLEEAVSRILRGVTRPLTIGLLEAGDVRRRFLLMAGIGLDGFIVRDVREGEKRVLGKGAYLLSAARHLWNWERERLEVIADGRKIDCHSAFVCNSARYGGSFILAPGADLFTPEFQIACMTGNTRVAFLNLALSVILGRVKGNGDIVQITASELTISGNKAVQVDGDYCCHVPVHITAIKRFVQLIT